MIRSLSIISCLSLFLTLASLPSQAKILGDIEYFDNAQQQIYGDKFYKRLSAGARRIRRKPSISRRK